MDKGVVEKGFHFQFTSKDAYKLLITLIVFEAFLIIAFFLGTMAEVPQSIFNLFNLDGEANIPAWFSSMQLFLVGILFLFSSEWSQRHRIVSPKFLLLVGVGFIFLSLDEAAEFHEGITRGFQQIAWMPRFNGKHGIWIFVYAFVALGMAVMGIPTLKSMLKLYPRQVLIVAVGFTITLIGAVGMEIIGYLYLLDTEKVFLYNMEVALEELFEMVGASLMLYGVILCALRSPDDKGRDQSF